MHKYAQHYRQCGRGCVDSLAAYLKPDLQFFFRNTSLWGELFGSSAGASVSTSPA